MEAIDVEVTANDNLSTQPVWAQQYNILKLLFQHLKIQDLLSAAQVCKVWSDVGKNVRKKRWNLPYVMPYSPDLEIPPPRPGQGHGQGEVRVLSPLDTGLNVEWTASVEPPLPPPTYEDAVLKALQNFSEPQFVILIGTEGWQNTQFGQEWEMFNEGPIRRQLNWLREAMFSKFPNFVPGLGLFTSGVVTTYPNDLGTFEVELPTIPVITGLAIPKVPGLRLKTFTLDNAMKMKYARKTTQVHTESKNPSVRDRQSDFWRENCEEILNIAPEDNVKGILLFNGDYGKSKNTYALTAVHEYIKKHPETAMGGGVMYDTVTSTKNQLKLTGSGILICSDDENINLRVGSTAMYDARMTSTNEENLLKFKKNGMDDGTGSFALMFACNGRGFNMHRTPNVESGLFQRHYPKTPLIGAFTMGEYVHEFIPGEEVIVPEKVKDLKHSFATVFTFVSWKRN